MANKSNITAKVREISGTAHSRRMRRAGLIPAVVYGPKQKNVNLELVERDITKLLSKATSEHILVDLQIENGPKLLTLIQDVQHHFLKHTVTHVDFLAVDETIPLHSKIPVIAIGESDGVRNYGGNLEMSMHEIEIECLPNDLPEKIEVDVTALKIGDSIHVRDLALPAGVKARTGLDITIIRVAAPRTEVAATPGATSTTEPEVIKEKKPVEGAAEAKKDGKK